MVCPRCGWLDDFQEKENTQLHVERTYRNSKEQTRKKISAHDVDCCSDVLSWRRGRRKRLETPARRGDSLGLNTFDHLSVPTFSLKLRHQYCQLLTDDIPRETIANCGGKNGGNNRTFRLTPPARNASCQLSSVLWLVVIDKRFGQMKVLDGFVCYCFAPSWSLEVSLLRIVHLSDRDSVAGTLPSWLSTRTLELFLSISRLLDLPYHWLRRSSCSRYRESSSPRNLSSPTL